MSASETHVRVVYTVSGASAGKIVKKDHLFNVMKSRGIAQSPPLKTNPADLRSGDVFCLESGGVCAVFVETQEFGS